MSRDSGGFGPAVLDGRMRYVSVSAIEKYDTAVYGGCERRWWFRYVAHKSEPQIRAQKLGVQVHAQIEHYLKTGEMVLGDLARAGLRFIPEPIPTGPPGLSVELQVGQMREHLPGGIHGPIDSEIALADVPVIGFLDILNARGIEKNDAGEVVVEPNVVEALDWKTTKRIDDEIDPDTGLVTAKGLAKSAEALAETHQMVTYGRLALVRYPHAIGVRLGHGVFQTEGVRKAVKRSIVITPDEVRARSRKSEAVVERMKGTATIEDVAKVPANLEACTAYRGCPHQAHCPRSPKAVLAQLFGGNGMSLLDKYKTRTETPAAPPITTAPPIEVVYEKPSADAVSAEAAKLAAEEAALRSSVSVTPPDAPEPTKTATLVFNGTTSAPPAEETKPEPTKKPRKKAEKAAADVLEAHAGAFERLADGPAGIVLYLNAIEDGVSFKRLETYAYALADELAKAEGAADVRCAPEKSSLAFGKWKGALAAVAKASPPPPGAYLASMSDEIVAVVAEALTPSAARVVRGIR